MLLPLQEIDWADPLIAIPAFLTVATIPLTFSIANGIGLGIIAYAVLKLISGKARPSDWLLMVLAAVFIFRFFWM